MFKYSWDSYNLDRNDVILQHSILAEDFKLHSHDFTELVIVLGGEGSHIVEDKKFPIQKGDVYVITGEAFHGFETSRRLEIINVLFNPKEILMEEIRKELNGYRAMFEIEPRYRMEKDFKAKLTLDILQIKDITRICDEILLLSKLRTKENRILVKTLVNVLIAKLSSLYNSQKEAKPMQLIRFSSVIDYMESHLAEEIDTKILARISSFSPRHFTRLFKDIFCVTPKQYMMNLRLTEACKLLLESDLTISELSARCGYPDSSYFSRLFFERFQSTPKEYRKILLEKKE